MLTSAFRKRVWTLSWTAAPARISTRTAPYSPFLTPLEKPTIMTADGRLIEAAGRGKMCMMLPNGSGQSEVTLLDAVYAPQMPFTLISIHKLDEAKCNMQFHGSMCSITSTDGVFIATVPSSGGLYKLGVSKNAKAEHANIAYSKMSLMEAHRRLGHISCNSITHAVNNKLTLRIQIEKGSKESFCEVRARGKTQHKQVSQKASKRSAGLGAQVHVDIWGPARITSLGGA